MRNAISTMTIGALMLPTVAAQFVSGSSGTDGALNIVSNTTLQIQDDGIHEYTTGGIRNTLEFQSTFPS